MPITYFIPSQAFRNHQWFIPTGRSAGFVRSHLRTWEMGWCRDRGGFPVWDLVTSVEIADTTGLGRGLPGWPEQTAAEVELWDWGMRQKLQLIFRTSEVTGAVPSQQHPYLTDIRRQPAWLYPPSDVTWWPTDNLAICDYLRAQYPSIDVDDPTGLTDIASLAWYPASTAPPVRSSWVQRLEIAPGYEHMRQYLLRKEFFYSISSAPLRMRTYSISLDVSHNETLTPTGEEVTITGPFFDIPIPEFNLTDWSSIMPYGGGMAYVGTWT